MLATKQPLLFADADDPQPVPIARKSDPATSHAAAAEITASGTRGQMMLKALELVKEHPGHTSNELEEISGLLDGKIRKRLNDLWHRGLVRKGEIKVSSVSGMKNHTWWPV